MKDIVKMKEVITQLENIDFGKEILVTMQSVSEYNLKVKRF